MTNVYIFDPTKTDPLSQFRGGGRIIQILKENLPEAKFINNLNELKHYHLSHDRGQDGNSVFLNPIFQPFQSPLTLKRVAKKQIQIIFDVIPLKYPNHFPAGIRGKLNLFLNKLALRNYDKIVTISNHSKKEIAQYLKIQEDKIEVVYPCLPKKFITSNFQTQLPNQLLNPNLTSNFCLYVGDVNWNKNLVNLARAIKIINVTCVFVGKAFENMKTVFNKDSLRINPWQKEFRDFLTEVGDDKRFIFLGYLDDYKLIKLYQQARVNILVSRDEGFGFSFLEAASQSCPSVLSDIKVFHETAADAAWFANPNDRHNIANKIGEIYFNNDLRDKLGKKANERINNFSSIKFRKDFLKAILR